MRLECSSDVTNIKPPFESSRAATITAELAGFRRFTWEHFYLLVRNKMKGVKFSVQTGCQWHETLQLILA